jgi:puromycin-sensitive aminopeptidase
LGGNKRRLVVKQTRFLDDGTKDDSTVWQVPITIVTESSPNEIVHKALLTEREQEIILDNVADSDWVKLNAGMSGFYRVQYSDEMFKQLLNAVQTKKLRTEDRFNIANDLFALVKSGRVPAAQFLALFAASVNEEEYIVWESMIAGVGSLLNVVARGDPALKEKFDNFVCSVLVPVANRLGWEVKPGEGNRIIEFKSR